MKKLRWQIIIVLLALAAIAVLLVSQQPLSVVSLDGGEKPVAGGVYTEALIGSLSRLNPLLDYYNSVDYDVDRLIFSGLIRFDHRGLPHGDLADAWGIASDGKTYSFSIRPDANWHDGQPVTSADIIFTIEQMQDASLPLPEDLRAFWSEVDVEAIDDKTISFYLPEAFSPFLDYLTFGVLPKHLIQNSSGAAMIDSSFNVNPIGSGPFRIEKVDVQGEHIASITLRAFSDYYGEKPFLDQLVFRYYPDDVAALQAYNQGEVMGVSYLTENTLVDALRSPTMNVYTGRLPRLTMVYLNLDDPALPFFQDAAIRRALLMSINRRWIIDRLFNGQAIQAHGPIFPESWAYYDGIEKIEYDAAGAVSLLKDAGYTIPAEGGNVRVKDGTELAFELLYPENGKFQAMAERMSADWGQLGIQVELKAVPYEELIADYLEPRKYQAALVDINFSRSPDPDPYPFWHQAQITNGQNYSQWDDRQVSEYLEQGRVQDDVNERTKRYKNFQVRFAAELPALPLLYPMYSYGVDQKVRGVSMGPLYDPSDRFNSIFTWYLLTTNVAQNSVTPTP